MFSLPITIKSGNFVSASAFLCHYSISPWWSFQFWVNRIRKWFAHTKIKNKRDTRIRSMCEFFSRERARKGEKKRKVYDYFLFNSKKVTYVSSLPVLVYTSRSKTSVGISEKYKTRINIVFLYALWVIFLSYLRPMLLRT